MAEVGTPNSDDKPIVHHFGAIFRWARWRLFLAKNGGLSSPLKPPRIMPYDLYLVDKMSSPYRAQVHGRVSLETACAEFEDLAALLARKFSSPR